MHAAHAELSQNAWLVGFDRDGDPGGLFGQARAWRCPGPPKGPFPSADKTNKTGTDGCGVKIVDRCPPSSVGSDPLSRETAANPAATPGRTGDDGRYAPFRAPPGTINHQDRRGSQSPRRPGSRPRASPPNGPRQRGCRSRGAGRKGRRRRAGRRAARPPTVTGATGALATGDGAWQALAAEAP